MYVVRLLFLVKMHVHGNEKIDYIKHYKQCLKDFNIDDFKIITQTVY